MKNLTLAAGVALFTLACGEGGASKAWNALSTCLAGSAAQKPIAERVQQLRLIQIANTPAKGDKAWPARCTPYANELFAASGDLPVLRRKLQARLDCGDAKGSCVLPADSSLPTLSTELWEAAASAGLKLEPSPNVPVPAASPPPLFNAPSWKSFSSKPLRVLGPLMTPDGRGLLLLTPGEGRARPMPCEFAAGFAKVRCFAASDQMPELPTNGLSLLNDKRGVYAAGLSETGLVAYNLETGAKSDVAGTGKFITADGVAVQRAVVKDKKVGVVDEALNVSVVEQMKNDGFVAVEIKDGKASKEMKIAITPEGEPMSLGNQIVYLTKTEAGQELVAKSLAGGRLKDLAALKGNFQGPFHSCRSGDRVALATYGAHPGQHGAKPTSPDGKTQLTFTQFSGSWSKVAEATLPFARALDSDLVCSKAGASVFWVSSPEGSAAKAGRLDCNGEGCKSSEVELPGLESKWWWSVGPIGDKVFVLYRSSLGDTRLRVSTLAELPNAKDTLVFDSPDFGGPNPGQVSALLGDEAALLIFKEEQPIALRIGADGSARLLVP